MGSRQLAAVPRNSDPNSHDLTVEFPARALAGTRRGTEGNSDPNSYDLTAESGLDKAHLQNALRRTKLGGASPRGPPRFGSELR